MTTSAETRTTAGGAPKRSRMSAEDRRAHIVTAARKVFIERGVAGARTRDIAAEAGVNEALLYRHFASKEEIFEVAVAEPLERAIAGLVETSGEPPAEFDSSGETMFERTHSFLRDLMVTMSDIAPLLGVIMFSDIRDAEAYYRERLAPALAQIEAAIHANFDSWNHRDFDPAMLSELVFGSLWFRGTVDRLAGRTSDPDEVATKLTELLLNAIRLDGPEGSSAS